MINLIIFFSLGVILAFCYSFNMSKTYNKKYLEFDLESLVIICFWPIFLAIAIVIGIGALFSNIKNPFYKEGKDVE